MKHKFTGEICVFCNKAPSDTSDHALGRKFFLEERRGDLPQVPACKSCNNKKAEYEAYLMTVLPFGAKNSDAGQILSKLVPRRAGEEREAPPEIEARLRRIRRHFDSV